MQLLAESNYPANLTNDLPKLQPCLNSAESFDTLCTSDTDPNDSLDDSARVTKCNTKRRRRVTMKQQIDSLHDTVQELTKQLQSLESETLNASESCDVIWSENVNSKILWQQVASRQLERRREAEKDNAELRTMVAQQILEAKNLKRILKRRTRIEMMEEMLGVKRQKMLANDMPHDHNDLRRLLRCTDELYVGVDQQFKEIGMERVSCPGEARHLNSCATDDVFLEILVQQLVPFGEKVTEKAVWSALGQIGMQPLQCKADTMMISYAAGTSGFRGSELQTTRIQKVMRKYVEIDRIVFVCRIEAQPHYISGRSGMKHRCDIQVVVETAESLDDDPEMMTVIKSYYRVSRHVPLGEDYRSYTKVDMAIAIWDEAISRVTGDIESILLEADSQVLDNI
ncbi:hypothetical protein PHPALM_31322 [Phytophthora palmivora]|uniref:M96 mating-specific protein family n=1 Tax=Phytophthora palmivora TaxID=4796 RepID=A0A2P4X2W0_9STRA|nr:hypothetical protein PHPALM_31322 [Phytophthora palmivora]